LFYSEGKKEKAVVDDGKARGFGAEEKLSKYIIFVTKIKHIL